VSRPLAVADAAATDEADTSVASATALVTASMSVADEADASVARAAAHAVLAPTPEFERAVRRTPGLRRVAQSILADLSPDDVAALARVLLASVSGTVPKGAAGYGRPAEAEQRARELAWELECFTANNNKSSRSQAARDKAALAIAEVAELLPPSLGGEAPPHERAKALLKRARKEARGAKERP